MALGAFEPRGPDVVASVVLTRLECATTPVLVVVVPDRATALMLVLEDGDEMPALDRPLFLAMIVDGSVACDGAAAALRAALAQAQASGLVRDALIVGRDRWRSVVCGATNCCPPNGRLLMEHGDHP